MRKIGEPSAFRLWQVSQCNKHGHHLKLIAGEYIGYGDKLQEDFKCLRCRRIFSTEGY